MIDIDTQSNYFRILDFGSCVDYYSLFFIEAREIYMMYGLRFTKSRTGIISTLAESALVTHTLPVQRLVKLFDIKFGPGGI